MLKLPKVIGHRGAASYAPENTLEGLRTAAEMGVEWVEFDVKLTRDDVPILFHDDTLERTTNGSGNVADHDYEDIQNLEAGSWFSEGFTGISVPTLEEALEVILEHDLGINVEIKPCQGREEDTTKVALDILSQVWTDHDKILISSFQTSCLEVARDIAGDWARGLLLDEEIPQEWPDLADYLDVNTININGNTLSKSDCEWLLKAELPLLAYTINDPERARELQRWGIDGFFSDAPDVILDNLLIAH